MKPKYEQLKLFLCGSCIFYQELLGQDLEINDVNKKMKRFKKQKTKTKTKKKQLKTIFRKTERIDMNLWHGERIYDTLDNEKTKE